MSDNIDDERGLTAIMAKIQEYWVTASGEPELKEFAKYVQQMTANKIKETESDVLFDLDEIENKPWRVFRQLAVLMPEYSDIYKRYERFYANGGNAKVMKLIEEFELTNQYKGESDE